MTGQRAIEAGTPPSPEVSVVIPVHDNAATLEQLHARLTSTLVQMGQPFELVFVDDASKDASLEVLGQIASRDARTVVLPLPRNVGQHQALLAGIARACGHWTLMIDADLQDAPETVVSLLAQRGQGYAAVFGGRRGDYESRGRLITSRVYKQLQHWVAGVPVDAGTFVLVSAPLKEALLRMQGPIVVAIGCSGLPMTSVPVIRAARPGGISGYSGLGRMRSACRSLWWPISWKWAARRRSQEGHG